MTSCKAVVLDRHGGTEVLELREVDVPEPGPGMVRVRVRAVALNHLDLWVRRGLAKLKLQYPHRLGSDIVGEIEALGPGVEGLTVGSKTILAPGVSCGVCEACASGADNLCQHYAILGENTQGGYAGLLSVPRANIFPYPEGLSWVEAAALPLTFLTAWQMLALRARVGVGEVVLVHGAGSGVGVAAIQLAKLFGARVWATAGSEAKCTKALELGAERVWNYTQQDWLQETRILTGKRGVDVVFEHVGGATFEQSLLALRRGGRLVTCGATSGFEARVDLRQIFFRQLQVLGSTMGPRSCLYDILRAVGAGQVRPLVAKVFPLEDCRRAHEMLEAREAFGKIVLEHP